MRSRIVLVEDDECFGTMFIYNLEALGIYVEWLRCPLEAEERLSVPPYPDLVVLDWKLPRIGGTELLRQMRCRRETANLPVMMLTSHSERENKDHAFALGATDFIPKGMPLNAVLARIQSILDMTQHQRVLAGAA